MKTTTSSNIRHLVLCFMHSSLNNRNGSNAISKYTRLLFSLEKKRQIRKLTSRWSWFERLWSYTNTRNWRTCCIMSSFTKVYSHVCFIFNVYVICFYFLSFSFKSKQKRHCITLGLDSVSSCEICSAAESRYVKICISYNEGSQFESCFARAERKMFILLCFEYINTNNVFKKTFIV